MATILKDIQQAVIKYAHLIEQVTKVDVEIVDTKLKRIAGTGMKNMNLSKSMASEGNIYNHVLKTGQPCYIDNPREHELCKACLKKDNCHELLELVMPIDVSGEIIGVIGLICFNEAAKSRVTSNFTLYWEFTRTIADFISAKAFEHQDTVRTMRRMGVLNKVISHVSEGLLLLRQDGFIQGANTSAREQLSCNNLEGTRVSVEETGDMILDQKEYAITLNKRRLYVVGDMISVHSDSTDYDDIFLFTNIKNIKSTIYKLTNLNPKQEKSQIVGNTAAMVALKKKIQKIAESSSTVLITGESGTGKDLIARVIHSEGSRKDKPFVAVNCGAIPDTLLESELFGYVKGSFTGADPRGKIGKFEMADKGIIFLDEIGDMPLYLQVKLLRVLQERKISRIGSNQVIHIDIRIIAATNKDLVSLIRENKFRRDLYYRLHVIPLHVPPLRERQEDIPALTYMLLEKYGRLFSRKGLDIDDEAMVKLMEYSWPGNVRELENTIEFMINMSETDVLTESCLPENVRHNKIKNRGYDEITKQTDEIIPLKELERRAILHAVEVCGETVEGKQEAAKRLGIGIATLYRKLEKYH